MSTEFDPNEALANILDLAADIETATNEGKERESKGPPLIYGPR